jgi:hypothetical protein
VAGGGEGDMKIEGLLREHPLAEVLRRIGRDAGTGILTVQGEGDIVGVTFLNGQVMSVDAVNQGLEDGLGTVLERQGLVPREVFAGLVAEQESGQGRVPELLLERGLLSRDQLDAALRDKSRRLCRQALAWRDGRYRFYSGQEVAFERGLRPITVDDLLSDWERQAEASSNGGGAVVEVAEGGLAPEDFAPAVRERPWLLWLARPEAASWCAIGLAIAALVGLLGVAIGVPTRILLPLDGAGKVDASLQRQRQSAFYAKVDRAAKTHYLLEGSFPESLGLLVEERLLAPADLEATREGRLAYADAPVSYLVRLHGEADGEGKSHRTETVAGHFLLDPDFVVPEVIEFPPLVLLD